MSDTTLRRILALTLIGLVLVLTSCGVSGSYTPPFGLVTLSVGTEGISIQASALDLETPMGTFGLSVSGSIVNISDEEKAKLQTPDTGLLLIVRYHKQGALIDEAYQMNSGDSQITVIVDGHTVFVTQPHRVLIDASNSYVQTIEVKGPAAVSDTPVATAEVPTPTPTAMPTPTPTPTPKPCAGISGTYAGTFAGIKLSVTFDGTTCTGKFTVGPPLKVTGHFTGQIVQSTILLTVTPDDLSVPILSFSGTINPDGSISSIGSITIKDQTGKWKISHT